MKPRARRVTLAAAVMGTGVIAVLAVAHWGTVRDHVEAWWFQLTTKTETIEPQPGKDLPAPWSLHQEAVSLARGMGQPVILAVDSKSDRLSLTPMEGSKVPFGKTLEVNGYRLLEQRFPRKAYVVISKHVPEPLEEEEKAVPDAPEDPPLLEEEEEPEVIDLREAK